MEIEEIQQEIKRQYADYRAMSNEYPSYDILQFVRLPPESLPQGLRGSGTLASTNTNTSNKNAFSEHE